MNKGSLFLHLERIYFSFNKKLINKILKKKIIYMFNIFLSLLENRYIKLINFQNKKNWVIDKRVKKAILFGKKIGILGNIKSKLFILDNRSSNIKYFSFFMKNKKIKKNFFIKRGSFINKNLSIMDFLYIGSGVHIDKNVTIEPYVLIGDGVQIKKNVYLSALSQIGGFLISKDFFPTIIEENANIGRHCRIYENIIIKRGAIIESGVSIAKNSLIYDIVNRKKIKSKNNNILTIPENAIVVPGNKCNNSNYAKKKGISLYNSIIIKYIKNI